MTVPANIVDPANAAPATNTDPANAGAVNERLLAESKANKQKAKELQERLDEIEKKRLADEGNYKELLGKEQKEKEDLKASLISSNRKTLNANIKATIAKFAPDAVDLDDLMNQPKFKKLIEDGIDGEELTLNEEAAQKYVKAVYEAKPFLKKAAVVPGTHNGGKPKYDAKDPAAKDYSEMSQEERRAEKIKLLHERNQKK